MTGMHKELQLCRGIQVAPGDTGSAEQGYAILNLLSGSAEGFALNAETGGWNPALPPPKPGLWTDVPFSDGRTPYAGADMNVTETLRITVSAATHLRMSELLSDLYDMVEMCQRFWFDEFYNQPVFLWWWAEGAPGRQYALIAQIDVDVAIPTTEDDGVVIRDVVLTIEREPFWRAEVPPGANPILWTLFAQNKQPGLDYNYENDLRLVGTTSFAILYSLVSDTLENHVAYTNLTASANVQSNKNQLVIPASSIPGDAPALVQLTLSRLTNVGVTIGHFNYSFMVSQISKRTTQTMRNSDFARFVTMIPFTAGAYSGPTLQADTGGIGGFNVTTSTTIAASRLAITPSGAFVQYWSASLGLASNMQRGRFAVFVRCRQNSGSSGDIQLRLGFHRTGVGFVYVQYTDSVVAPLLAGTGNTTFWPLAYMGSIRLPLTEETEVLSTALQYGGTGLFNAENDVMGIRLEVLRSTGTALLYFEDVLLLPYDEAMLDATVQFNGTVGQSSAADTIVIDSTGYLSRGKPSQIAVAQNTLFTPASEIANYQGVVQQKGSELTLEPGVENTLYILEYNDNFQCYMASSIAASLNIVPRWRGIRAV